ncbi:MAG TPA: hypothetical protein VL346_08750 [Acidobacteriaceae bacterium]|nr:hypothetical protein [Acidobacteriaceae bacterium]
MNPQQLGMDGVMAAVHSLIAVRGLPTPRSGWLNLSRRHAGLSTRDVAKRRELSHQAITQFKQAERKGGITLANLRRMANAMGYELVYGIVPKAKPEAAVKPPTNAVKGDTASALTELLAKLKL